MRVRCGKVITLKCQAGAVFLALGGTGMLLVLCSQLHVLLVGHSQLSSSARQVTLPQGSTEGAPCLLTRLYGLNCSQLTLANESYLYEVAARKWKSSEQCRQEPLQYLVHDCRALREQHGYYRWPVTDQEQRFPLAFGLKIHHAPDMFARLLRVLWRPHNFYCIHVDSKTPPEVYDLIKNVTDCFDNVVMAQTRIDLVYLSVASLLVDMECMRMAFKSTIPWKYYLNLSGQEFPLKTNLELVQIMTLLNGKNDVESYLPTRYVTSWFTIKHRIDGENLIPTKRKKDPFMYPVQIRKGSAYGAFNRQFLDFALNSHMAQEFLHWLSDAMAPDELFWATLNHMPGVPGAVLFPVSHRYKTVLARAVAWQWDDHKCRLYQRGVCIFTTPDLPWLAGRPELIANKFDEKIDPIVLDCLETALEDRALSGYREVGSSNPVHPRHLLQHLNWAFYTSLPHLQSR